MTQKLAIVISGAVSLGSYEAGVLYETIEAIAQHNEHPDTTEEQKIEIDVITGASAGAMIACMLTQKLLFEADALRNDPYNNDLYNAWVEDVDIEKFLQIKENDDPAKFLLSSQTVKEIGYKYLLDRYNSNSAKPIQTHPGTASYGISLGIAMSNLNGFDFEKKPTEYQAIDNSPKNLSNGSSFKYTQHKDCFTTEIKPGIEYDQKSIWEKIEEIGRSSGAFPFAFSVVDIERKPDEEEIYQDAIDFSQPKKFTYTDGSVFENEPFGIAKSLVNKIDTKPTDYENRFYLYIAPGLQESEGEEEENKENEFSASNANYLTTAKALVGAVYNQAKFQDWIRTQEVNQKIRKFDVEAIKLKEILEENQSLKEKLNDVSTELLNVLYNDNHNSSEKDYQRLKEQFETGYNDLKNRKDQSLADTWVKIVQVLEKAADLGDRDIMKIYAITSTKEELVGEELGSFLGFFDRELRHRDYETGRRNAVKSLQRIQDYNKLSRDSSRTDETRINQEYKKSIIENDENQSHREIYFTNFELENKSLLPSIDPEVDFVADVLNQEDKIRNISNDFAKVLSKLIYTLIVYAFRGKDITQPEDLVSKNLYSDNSSTQKNNNIFAFIIKLLPLEGLLKVFIILLEKVIDFLVFRVINKWLRGRKLEP